MIDIGITGGIGSGKSFICAILQKMGYPVYFSDLESKKISDTNLAIRVALIDLFGDNIYDNNKLNRPLLASKIFESNSDDLRLKVNSIIHPHVRAGYQNWKNEQNSSFVFNEAAILFETGAYKNFDKTILVTAPEELRIKRVMDRDSVSKQDVEARIAKQLSDTEKIKLADFVIYNDGRPVLEQIEEIIEKI